MLCAGLFYFIIYLYCNHKRTCSWAKYQSKDCVSKSAFALNPIKPRYVPIWENIPFGSLDLYKPWNIAEPPPLDQAARLYCRSGRRPWWLSKPISKYQAIKLPQALASRADSMTWNLGHGWCWCDWQSGLLGEGFHPFSLLWYLAMSPTYGRKPLDVHKNIILLHSQTERPNCWVGGAYLWLVTALLQLLDSTS